MANSRVRVRFRRDRGWWEVDYRDRDGVRRRPLFATEEEAHERAAEVLRELGLTLPVAVDRDVTVHDYAERWLVNIAVDKEAQTVRSYSDWLRRHLLPALGHLKLREVRRWHIKTLRIDKRRQGHAKNGVRLMKAVLLRCSRTRSTTGSSDHRCESRLPARTPQGEPRGQAQRRGARAEDPPDELGRARGVPRRRLRAPFPNEAGRPADIAKIARLFHVVRKRGPPALRQRAQHPEHCRQRVQVSPSENTRAGRHQDPSLVLAARECSKSSTDGSC